MYEASAGELRLALTGDTIPTRRLAVYREDRYLAVRDLLRGADAAFSNLEGAVHRYLDGGQTQARTNGTYMTTEPSLVPDLQWLGISLLACGSSHADDYGPDGILETIEHLDRAGLTHAGSGRHLAEARAPAFLDTPRGRVALVAASAFPDAGRAGEQRPDSPGYPGVNGIRHSTVHHVDRATYDALRRAGRELGWDAEQARLGALGDPQGDDGTYDFLGRTFRLAGQHAIRTHVDPRDLESNLRQIAHAKANADRVVVSFHCHDQGGPTYRTAPVRSAVEELADYAVEFAHAAIDAGADVFVAHGPQAQLGVEIYRGRPIFHGLGIFVFQLETVQYLPHEAYERYGLPATATPFDFVDARYAGETRGHPADRQQWEHAVYECDFDGDGLREIRVHPVELGFGEPRHRRGRPLVARPEAAARVLDRITRLSEQYGTVVERDGDIGKIRP